MYHLTMSSQVIQLTIRYVTVVQKKHVIHFFKNCIYVCGTNQSKLSKKKVLIVTFIVITIVPQNIMVKLEIHIVAL